MYAHLCNAWMCMYACLYVYAWMCVHRGSTEHVGQVANLKYRKKGHEQHLLVGKGEYRGSKGRKGWKGQKGRKKEDDRRLRFATYPCHIADPHAGHLFTCKGQQQPTPIWTTANTRITQTVGTGMRSAIVYPFIEMHNWRAFTNTHIHNNYIQHGTCSVIATTHLRGVSVQRISATWGLLKNACPGLQNQPKRCAG